MRILHAVECDAGGVLTLLRTYCAAQVAAGHDVRVLAPHDQLPEVGWRCWHIDRHRPASFGVAGRELRSLVRTWCPDVVHIHSFFAGAVGRAALSGRPGAPAVVYQPHSWAYDAVSARGARLVVSAVEHLLDHRTNQLVCNCPDELEEGRRNGVHAPGTAVGVPVDLREYAPPGQRVRARLRSQLAQRPHMVLCVGRLTRQKGQDRLVAAWRRSPVPDAELVLVGGGPVDELRTLAGEEWGRSVRWVGHQEDIRPWLGAADVLVVPSRYEGQSVAVSEALACGLPVVACAVNGAADAVVAPPQPAAGAVVEREDVAALLRECSRRVLDGSLREREAEAARQRAVELFGTVEVCARVEQTYRAAMSTRPRARQRVPDQVGA